MNLTVNEIYSLFTTKLKEDLNSYLNTERGQLTMKFRVHEMILRIYQTNKFHYF